MKRLILIAILVLAGAFSASAQYADAPKYKDLKEVYNFRMYMEHASDPYNAAMAGLFGFFTPGVPQLLMNESLRGALFFGGSAFCFYMAEDAASELTKLTAYDTNGQPYYTDTDKAEKYTKLMLGFLAADLGIAIWSCIDAKRVAKVKNMYFQDVLSRQAQVGVSVQPFLSYTPVQGDIQPAAGLSMKLSF